ncbi:hypothetical protein N8376_06840 [Flavobacteriaceae bacterium]|nr:hypothetical protein [Flavobacteriaceae bacterium]
MKKLFLFLIFTQLTFSQSKMDLPYYEISEYPETYSSVNIISRMIDGLGFRFYWASEKLTKTDLDYKISKDSRSTIETINHIHSLSVMILNAVLNKTNDIKDEKNLEYETLRRNTLLNFKRSSEIISKSENLSSLKIIFNSGGKISEFPLWNLINGPIEDAVWHTGQVVAFRRANGNPISSKISVFTGKVKN